VTRRALLAGLLCAAFTASTAPAGESWSSDLRHELMSPFCPGMTLAKCPSGQAEQLWVWIQLQEAAGATREEVEAQLVERYGEGILPAPPPRDFMAIAGYAVPILAIVAGAPLVYWLLRRLTRSAPDAATATGVPATGPIDDSLAAEVDRELREREA
jgi:cytochrome c-type biogenesis protein CcmH/NrfF